MKRVTKIQLVVSFLAALTASAVFAQATNSGNRIAIADDSSSGTYKKMLGEIIGVCSSDAFEIVEAKGVTGGAPGNLDALVNNKAEAAFLHSDVFFASAQADPAYKRFQTLVALYPEPIHVLALKLSLSPKLATFAIGKQEFSSLADMRGYVIGASGGGVYTARILQGQGEGGFTVNTYNSGKEVLDALSKGEIAAAIFVGAAPLPNIAPLDKNVYKLLPIGERIAGKVQGVYRPVNINYNGLTNGPIKTLAPMATLLTRRYSTEGKLAAQRNFRACFYKKLDELKDNGSPNWQQVEANDHGVLDWYEIPAASGAAGKKQ